MEQGTEATNGKRALKKVWRREEDPPDVGDQGAQSGGAFHSFKTALTNENLNGEDKEDYENDEFVLNGGDIIMSTVDGMLDIHFSDKVHTLVLKTLVTIIQYARGISNAGGGMGTITKLVGGECGRFGRVKEGCPKLNVQKETEENDEEEMGQPKSLGVKQPTAVELDRKEKSKNYGEWMTVTRNYKRQSRRNLDELEDQTKAGIGSRFVVIANSIYEDDLTQLLVIGSTDVQKGHEDLNGLRKIAQVLRSVNGPKSKIGKEHFRKHRSSSANLGLAKKWASKGVVIRESRKEKDKGTSVLKGTTLRGASKKG
ncbi:hypothetical protein J1N35_023734 [Gossypium stocksii]|uniref:Uncharacterized protein n=1 Tax=Gossypium stocksii TaxID=47602 RepID=A0A9D3VJA7_9ROSI|nr:hypothetical protein J1N35_023734 [Gossypium stocksii]